MQYTFHSEKGVSIYIAVLITVVLLSIALGLSSGLLVQIETLRGIGHSVLAFYAADAGIERVLFIDASTCASITPLEDRVTCIKTAVAGLSSGDKQLSNGASYELTAEQGGEGTCPVDDNYCSSSTGIYTKARRAIRITR